MTSGTQFGRGLRAVRKARKLKIGQLAERVEKGVKHLGRLERGEKQPSFELMIALANAMSVSPAAFFEHDLNEHSEKSLRANIRNLIARCDIEELKRIQRVLTALVNH
jgi:transcriptional regulator with XRE-family HTH domain